jgi:hypothetical protein
MSRFGGLLRHSPFGAFDHIGRGRLAAYQSYLATEQKERDDRLQTLIEEQQFQRDSQLQLQKQQARCTFPLLR